MRRWALLAIAVVGCHRSPSARERALERLPGSAQLVAAADGAALATPAVRHLIDVARPHIPGSLGCVIDAALAGDAIAVASDRAVGVAIVLVTSADVTQCPALSMIGPGVWTATIGGATLAPVRATSVEGDPRWDRAIPYLEDAPVALALDLGKRHIIAAAKPDPVALWVTIDTADKPDADAVEMVIRAVTAGWKLDLSRSGDQIVVRSAAKLEQADLVTMVGSLLRALDPPPPPVPPTFTCPRPSGVLVSCVGGTHLVVSSLSEALDDLTSSVTTPVVSGGDVIGLRVSTDTLVLQRGDVILGIDTHRITSGPQLLRIIRSTTGHASVAVRRGTADVVIDVRQE